MSKHRGLYLSNLKRRTKQKRMYQPRRGNSSDECMCPYPRCNRVVRRIHNQLSDKHKLSRKDPCYIHAVFEELDDDPVLVSSTSTSSSPKESDAESELDDGNNSEQSDTTISSVTVVLRRTRSVS